MKRMLNKFIFISFILIVVFPISQAQEEAPASENSDYSSMSQYYDKGFEYYRTRDYSKAIENWNKAINIDPQQVTARKMIEDARKKLDEANKGLKSAIQDFIAKGKYSQALAEANELLGMDPTNPDYQKLFHRLSEITRITSSLPRFKPWLIAGIGVRAFLQEPEDMRLAYDAFRYAKELAPKETGIGKMLVFFESEHPELVLEESLPPGIGLLDYKKNTGLHCIYDAKYHLAVKELSAVLALEPNDVVALKRIGSAYYQLKDKARAKDAWMKAYKVSPEDAQLKRYLEQLDAGGFLEVETSTAAETQNQPSIDEETKENAPALKKRTKKTAKTKRRKPRRAAQTQPAPEKQPE